MALTIWSDACLLEQITYVIFSFTEPEPNSLSGSSASTSIISESLESSLKSFHSLNTIWHQPDQEQNQCKPCAPKKLWLNRQLAQQWTQKIFLSLLYNV